MPGGERKNLISTSIHVEVLAAARRQCDAKDWTFKPVDIVLCLPHLNPSSVRTHVVSRCCVNAPVNHAHRWPYFRRMKRGVYQILPEFRQTVSPGAPSGEESTVGEVAARYEKQLAAPSAIHAVVVESDGWYVAECLETAVVTQGRSLDELLGNLRSALELQLDDEEIARAGLSPKPRLVLSYETPVFTP